jgi:glycosyltransferase involved in cell wall biosynthesis
MSRARRYDVCASVISDLEFDARVWKEARSLASSGRRVALIGPAFDIDVARHRRDPSGVEVLEVPMGWRQRKKSYLLRVTALLRVWLAVVRTDAAAYHAHDIHVVLPAWLASRLRRAKLVYDAHELWAEAYGVGVRARIAAWGGARLERLMLRRADAVITTNHSRADALTKRYGRKDIVVLANVPFLQEDLGPDGQAFPAGKRVVLYVGRISYEGRAFREAVHALPLLDSDVHLVMLGFGWEAARERIRGWAREVGVEERVHFLAPRPFDELIDAAAAATVGLVPIHGFPLSNRLGDTNKLHEYLMGGLPVAASDLPEIRRVVTMGDPPVGELFDSYSPESIARAIRTVIDDDRYPARRREARRLAIERFNWGIEERQLLELYDRLLRAAPASGSQIGREGS